MVAHPPRRWARAFVASGSVWVSISAVAPATAAPPPDDFVAQQLSFRAVRAVEAWGVTTGSSGVVVAIVDSGIDPDHPDLVPNVLPGWDFVDDDGDARDPLGRGTHAAGVVGAVGGNGIGIAGLAWRVGLLPVRVLDGAIDELDVDPALGAEAIRYATDAGAGVILVDFVTGANDADLRAAIRDAVERDAVVIAAAGDDSRDLDRDPVYPAAWEEPGLLSVASVDQGAKLALSSNHGSRAVSLAAPGVGVFSTLPGGSAGRLSGTPAAAAHVAGAAALLRSLRPDLSAAEVADTIVRLASNRKILDGRVKSASILDLGLLLAEKRDTVDARIEAPDRARVGETVVFDGSLSEGPIVEYLWKFGDPLDEFGPAVPRRWSRPGRVGVELQVRTFDGRSASVRHEITIEGNDLLSSCAVTGAAHGRRAPIGTLLAACAIAAVLRRRIRGHGSVRPCATPAGGRWAG